MNYSTGQRETYYWFEAGIDDLGFKDIIKKFPDFLLDHFIVISTFDSGPLTWTKEEEENGFGYMNGMAVTNKIENVLQLPFDNYDEWYVLRQLREIRSLEIFVNNGLFSLMERTYETEAKKMDPTWDFQRLELELNTLKELQNKFWSQLNDTQADKFLSQNGKFIFVTKDKNEIERLERHACLLVRGTPS